jgi:hypothetical protein
MLIDNGHLHFPLRTGHSKRLNCYQDGDLLMAASINAMSVALHLLC